MKTQLLLNSDIYEKVIAGIISGAKRFVWIGTADIKDMYVKKGSVMVPFLEILSDLIKSKIEVRLMFAKEPGPAFRKDFDKYPLLIKYLEQVHCPRIHFKTVVVDGKSAYTGSANLTGAGMGMKSKDKRNFEAGILSNNTDIINPLMQQFDDIWIGKSCKSCGRKSFCGEWKFK